MSYTPIPEKYLRSCVPTENTDEAYIWVTNELYEFLLQNPFITKTFYETKNRNAYLDLVNAFVRKVPTRLYDTDFCYDWTLNGEDNGFMNQLRSAYNQIPKKQF
jgi:hypothetical protein